MSIEYSGALILAGGYSSRLKYQVISGLVFPESGRANALWVFAGVLSGTLSFIFNHMEPPACNAGLRDEC